MITNHVLQSYNNIVIMQSNVDVKKVINNF